MTADGDANQPGQSSMPRTTLGVGESLLVVGGAFFVLLLSLVTLAEAALLILFFANGPGVYTGQDGDRGMAMWLLVVLIPLWIAALVAVRPTVRWIRRSTSPGRRNHSR